MDCGQLDTYDMNHMISVIDIADLDTVAHRASKHFFLVQGNTETTDDAN